METRIETLDTAHQNDSSFWIDPEERAAREKARVRAEATSSAKKLIQEKFRAAVDEIKVAQEADYIVFNSETELYETARQVKFTVGGYHFRGRVAGFAAEGGPFCWNTIEVNYSRGMISYKDMTREEMTEILSGKFPVWKNRLLVFLAIISLGSFVPEDYRL